MENSNNVGDFKLKEKLLQLLVLDLYVLCKVSMYIGQGEYRRQKYKYKMYCPLTDTVNGEFYTTDVYTSIGHAKVAKFGQFGGNEPRIDEIVKIYLPAEIDFRVSNPEFYKPKINA